MFSHHAKQRFKERFPDLNISEQYDKATLRVGKKTRKKILEKSPRHKKYCTKAFNGRYMRRTREGIVFVVSKEQIVITVFES